MYRDIPRDSSTVAHPVIKENKNQDLGPPSEDGHATRDPFESGSVSVPISSRCFSHLYVLLFDPTSLEYNDI